MANLRIKEVIKEHGLTVDAVARRLGVLPSALSQSINGNPSADKLEKIAEAVGCSPAELFAPQPSHAFTCPHCGRVIEIKTPGE